MRLAYNAFVMLVSIIGLLIPLSIVTPTDDPIAVESIIRRSIAALAYAAVSFLGILAVLFPSACSGIIGVDRTTKEDPVTPSIQATRVLGVRLVHCHHLGAQMETHELQISGKSCCASCFGLLIGAILSMMNVGLFAVHGWPSLMDLSCAYDMYLLGATVAILGLVLGQVSRLGSRARFSISALFVIGTGFVLIATDTFSGSVTADLLAVLLDVFWILARLSLSR